MAKKDWDIPEGEFCVYGTVSHPCLSLPSIVQSLHICRVLISYPLRSPI